MYSSLKFIFSIFSYLFCLIVFSQNSEFNYQYYQDDGNIMPYRILLPKKYDENFFKQLDIIENNVLDGQSFNETVKNDNLEVVSISKINANKEDENKTKVENIKDNLFKKVYNLKNLKSNLQVLIYL